MTNQLIPTITGDIAGQTQTLVNARDLHYFLGTGRDFSNWIKKRIADYRFVEGRDFSPVLARSSDNAASRPKIEYLLTLRMAEHMAMVEKTKRGQQVRDYFIEMENRAMNRQPVINEAMCEELLKARPLWAKIAKYDRLGLSTFEICLLIQRRPRTLREHRRRMQACGLLARPDNRPQVPALTPMGGEA